MNLKQSIIYRARIAFIIMLVFAVFIVAQAFKLGVLERSEYLEMSEKQSIRLQEVKAIRGNILSMDGRLLATSMPKYEVRFDTKASGITDEVFKSKVDSLSVLLAATFTDKNYTIWKDYLTTARKNNERYLLIQQDVTYEIAKDLTDWPIFRMGKFKGGLIREERNVREMPFGYMARRTVGFKSDNGNAVGLEAAFDSLLRGTTGKRLEQRVSAKVWRPIGNTAFSPDNGCDIVTTIDINVQDVAEDALKRALQQSNAKSGCAVLMEVETGAIRAIANYSRLSNGSYFEDFNIAIGVASDPGSTMKLASAIALLESNAIVNLDDSVDINFGQKKFSDKIMVDAHLSENRKVTFKQVFEQSSNVGIASLVQQQFGANPQQYIDYLAKLNLDRPLGIELPEEGNIRIKKPGENDWYGTTLPWLSIGYESRITPLQILTLYNAVANNGAMVKPYFVNEIKKTGKSLWKHDPVYLNPKICSDNTLKKLHLLLEGVVENGTAKKLKNLDYKVAGKTGTVQVLVGTRYDKGQHKATFVGYFPADKPKYTCIVVVNGPTGGLYSGAQVAGPVFAEIADKLYATMKEIHPDVLAVKPLPLPFVKNGLRYDIKTVLNNLGISSYVQQNTHGSDWVTTTRENKSIRLVEQSMDAARMPNVVGMGLKDALYLLESMGLIVKINGYGKVVSQSLNAQQSIKDGQVVYLNLKP